MGRSLPPFHPNQPCERPREVSAIYLSKIPKKRRESEWKGKAGDEQKGEEAGQATRREANGPSKMTPKLPSPIFFPTR